MSTRTPIKSNSVRTPSKVSKPLSRNASSTDRRKENVEANLTPSKKDLVRMQKEEAGRRRREEREKLREEKEKKQREFLEKTSMRREEQELNLEVQRMTTKHSYALQMTKKEIEAADLKWKLEQERLHRQDLRTQKLRDQERERQLKQRERECKQNAESRIREEEEKQRNFDSSFRQTAYTRARELVEEARLQEKNRCLRLEENARRERQETIRQMQEEAHIAEQESRKLDMEAYNDVQEYLQNEREARRKSLQVKHAKESSFKRQKEEDDAIMEMEEMKSRELELEAYRDMKRYLAQEKSKRRQSLADFLVQESQYRRKMEEQEDIRREKEAQSRELDEQAHRDMLESIAKEKMARRQSLAFRLHEASMHDYNARIQKMDDELKTKESRHLDSMAREDFMSAQEKEKDTHRVQSTYDKLNQLRAIEAEEKQRIQNLERIENGRQQMANRLPMTVEETKSQYDDEYYDDNDESFDAQSNDEQEETLSLEKDSQFSHSSDEEDLENSEAYDRQAYSQYDDDGYEAHVEEDHQPSYSQDDDGYEAHVEEDHQPLYAQDDDDSEVHVEEDRKPFSDHDKEHYHRSHDEEEDMIDVAPHGATCETKEYPYENDASGHEEIHEFTSDHGAEEEEVVVESQPSTPAPLVISPSRRVNFADEVSPYKCTSPSETEEPDSPCTVATVPSSPIVARDATVASPASSVATEPQQISSIPPPPVLKSTSVKIPAPPQSKTHDYVEEFEHIPRPDPAQSQQRPVKPGCCTIS